MRKFLTAANAFATVFSLIWLVGHATIRILDWEFWFAFGYLVLAGANSVYFLRRQP